MCLSHCSAGSSCARAHPDVVTLKDKDGRAAVPPGLDRHREQRVKDARVQHGLHLQDVTDGHGLQLHLGKRGSVLHKLDLPVIQKPSNRSKEMSGKLTLSAV